MRKVLCLLLPLVTLPLVTADDEPSGSLKDVAVAQRLARQHNRPIFAVLH